MEAAEQNASEDPAANKSSGEQKVNAVKRTSTTPHEAAAGPTGGGENATCTCCGGTSHTPAECQYKSAVCHTYKTGGHLKRMCCSEGRS